MTPRDSRPATGKGEAEAQRDELKVLCVCGHVYGVHSADPPYECLIGDSDDCSCPKFEAEAQMKEHEMASHRKYPTVRNAKEALADPELRRIEDETIAPDGELRPTLEKTVKRAHAAESALTELRQAAQELVVDVLLEITQRSLADKSPEEREERLRQLQEYVAELRKKHEALRSTD